MAGDLKRGASAAEQIPPVADGCCSTAGAPDVQVVSTLPFPSERGQR